MPTEIAIIVAAITVLFVIFALALAWVDFQTRQLKRAVDKGVLESEHIKS